MPRVGAGRALLWTVVAVAFLSSAGASAESGRGASEIASYLQKALRQAQSDLLALEKKTPPGERQGQTYIQKQDDALSTAYLSTDVLSEVEPARREQWVELHGTYRVRLLHSMLPADRRTSPERMEAAVSHFRDQLRQAEAALPALEKKTPPGRRNGQDYLKERLRLMVQATMLADVLREVDVGRRSEWSALHDRYRSEMAVGFGTLVRGYSDPFVSPDLSRVLAGHGSAASARRIADLQAMMASDPGLEPVPAERPASIACGDTTWTALARALRLYCAGAPVSCAQIAERFDACVDVMGGALTVPGAPSESFLQAEVYYRSESAKTKMALVNWAPVSPGKWQVKSLDTVDELPAAIIVTLRRLAALTPGQFLRSGVPETSARAPFAKLLGEFVVLNGKKVSRVEVQRQVENRKGSAYATLLELGNQLQYGRSPPTRKADGRIEIEDSGGLCKAAFEDAGSGYVLVSGGCSAPAPGEAE
jgi:hypothetical protein